MDYVRRGFGEDKKNGKKNRDIQEQVVTFSARQTFMGNHERSVEALSKE